MKEAPSTGGAFLVPATPHIEKPTGWVLVTVGVCSQGAVAVLTLGRLVLLRQHPNLAWNFGLQ